MSGTAKARIDAALASGETLFVSAVTLVELVYLVEKGRLPAVVAERMSALLDDAGSGLVVAQLDRGTADAVARVPRDTVPDMPDRIIAATALYLGMPLVTRDGKIRAADLETIW